LISKGGLTEFTESGEKTPPDLFVFGFDGAKEISYERELKGETVFFEAAARLSKRAKNTVVCGCITDTLGHKRKSVLVAENGKLLGVSDMLNAVDGATNGGAALRVYETKAGRMGVAVADDLHFPDVVKSLSVCGCDFVVCPFGVVKNSLQAVLLRAYSFCYGIPIFFCGAGYCMISDSRGEIVFASPQSPTYTCFQKVTEYHLIQTRRRGVFRPTI
jgi:predicted amidohydrolase